MPVYTAVCGQKAVAFASINRLTSHWQQQCNAIMFLLVQVETGVDRNGNSLSECDIAWGWVYRLQLSAAGCLA
jgi:hypothetical protein